MSTKTVDQRVVEMRFDNRNFEKNVSTTMSSLDKLKQKLNLKGAAKGFENIDSASKKVNMNGLASAVDTVRSRFSAMEVIGVTALANITNSAVNAGKRIVSALTIDPVKTGFSEYETQINAIQTIMANTSSKGTTLEDVTAALDTLNKYADKTIYNFTEMTRNIGTFTAAGVDLNTSVNAIQGIANLAAVSGSTSQQASTAMYQLSQALASGTVKLMDWNSVVNAGMGGEVFQNALKETARVHGVAIDDIIKKNGSFRDSLHEEWLTTDILTETLEKFTMATEGVSEAEIEANKQKLKSIGYTEKQIDEIFKLGNTATNAATKVKTFSQLWDTLKESAQSGWTQTWEIIVGDFYEAQAFLTNLSDGIGGFINKLSDWRNNLLEGALGSKWGQLTSRINEAGISTEDFNSKLKKVAKEHGIAIDDLIKEHKTLEGAISSGAISTDLITETLKTFAKEADNTGDSTEELNDKLEYFQTVVRKVWHGDYGNMEDRYKALTKAGYNYAEVQALVNKTVDGHELTLEDLTEAQLVSIGYTKEQAKAIKELADEAKSSGTPLNELIKSLDKPSGRTLLIQSLQNAAQGLVKSFTAMKDAWVEIFPPMTSNQLYNIIVAINNFSKQLRMSDDSADKLKRTFKGLFAIFDIALTLIGGPLKMAFKAILDILGLADIPILDLTARIGDAIVKFRDWIDEHNIFTIALKKVLPYLQKAAEGIRDWISGLKDSKGIGKDIIAGLAKGIWDGLKEVGKAALEIGKKIVNTVKEFLGIHSPSTVFMAIGGFIIAGLVLGLLGSSGDLWGAIQSIAKSVADRFKEGFSSIWELGKTVVAMLTNLFASISLEKIIAVGIGVGTFMVLFKVLSIIGNIAKAAAGIVEGLGDMFEGLGDMFEGAGKMLKGMGRWFTSMAIVNIVVALGLLVAALLKIVKSGATAGQLFAAIGVLTALGALLAVLYFVLGKIDDVSSMSMKGTLALIGITGSLLLLSIALSKFANIDLASAGPALALLAGVLAIMTGIMAIMSKLSKGTEEGGKAARKIGRTILAISLAMLLMVAVVKIASKMTVGDIIKGVAVVSAFTRLIIAIIAISSIAGDNAKDAGKMIFKMSVAMLLMIAVVKLASMISAKDVLRGTAVVILIGVMFAAILYISNLAGQNAAKAGSSILMMSIAMLAMVGVMKVASGMSKGEIARGLKVVAAMTGLFIAIVAISNIAGEHAVKAGVMMLAMSGAILIMVASAFLLSQMNPDDLARGLTAVTILAAIFAGLVVITKFARGDEIFKTLLMLTIVVALLGGLVIGMAFLNPMKLTRAVLAIAIIIAAFSGLIAVTKFAGGISIKALIAVALMTAIVYALANVIKSLADLEPGSSLSNAQALGVLIAAMSVALIPLTMFGSGYKNALKGAVALAAMAVPLAGIGLVLAMMSAMNVQNAIPNTIALATLLTLMTALLIPLTLIGVLGPTALWGVLALAAMAAPLALVGLVLAMMSAMKVQDALPNVKALSILLTVMTALLVPLTIIGVFGPAAIAGVGLLTAMMIPLAAAVLVLAMMKGFGVEDAITSVNSLTKLLTTLTLLLIPLTLVGAAAPLAISGIGTLMTFIGALAVLVAAASALAKIPGLSEFLDGGIKLLEQFASGLGSIIGSFIGGFAEGVTSSLPAIGEDLSAFMQSATAFIEGAKSVDDSVLNGAGILAGAIGALTILDLYKGEFSSEGAFAKLGAELSDFMKECQPFIDGAKSLDKNMVAGVKMLAETILTLTEADILDGLASFFGLGGNALSSFGKQLPQLGADLAAFSTSLTDAGLDKDKIKMVANAALAVKTLAEASASIPNSGGMASRFAGENDLGVFAEQFPKLGAGLRGFIDSVGTFADAELTTIDTACKAITSLATAAADIPNQGGMASWFAGENSLDTFATQFPKLGLGLRGFLDNVTAFGDSELTTVKNAAAAITSLASASAEIPNSGGMASRFAGENDLGVFAEQFPYVGLGLRNFIRYLDGLPDNAAERVDFAKVAIKTLIELTNEVPNMGGLFAGLVGKSDLSTFASQFPNIGRGIRQFVNAIGELTAGELLSTSRAIDVIKTLTEFSDINGKNLKKNVGDLSDSLKIFATGISKFSKTMSTKGAATSLKDAADGVRDLVDALSGITSGLAANLKTISESLKDLGTGGLKAFTEAFSGSIATSMVKDAANKMVDSFVDGVETRSKKIDNAFYDAAMSGYGQLIKQALCNSFISAGKHLADGFAAGIRQNTYKVVNAADVMASAAIRAAKAKLDEHSPSKVFYKIGDYAVQGFANALTAGVSTSYRSSQEMAEAATSGLTNAIARVSDMIQNGIDTQPTIRPVLDLDDVRAGASQIGGMLSMSPSVGVLSNVRSIASAMSRRGQNGVNDGVISELGKLRKDISALKHVSYNIEGISYGEGSSVAEAIETLVRAALMERRV